ncbi:MAG: nucleotidyltransferase domain-containing protein [Mariniphaga sp.]|jgi:predicted nucleotidyltransferase
MILRKERIQKLIGERIRQIDSDAEVYLFGSRARGDFKQDSDWDLLILTKNPVSLRDEQRFRHHLIPLELETGEAFSTFVVEKEDWETKHQVTPFYQSIKNELIRIT